MGGGGCGNCCDFHPIRSTFEFVRGLFCHDSGCGYHPGPSATEVHAKKLADELAQMKEKERAATEATETELILYISDSMDNFIHDLEKINHQVYMGKTLNINIKGIREKSEALKKEVVGHIGNCMDERLVLTDKELAVILEERNDEKRGKNFDAFCQRVRNQAIGTLKTKIEHAVLQQENLVRSEIQSRLNEVEKSAETISKEYARVIKAKEQSELEVEKKTIEFIYAYGLCDTLLDRVES